MKYSEFWPTEPFSEVIFNCWKLDFQDSSAPPLELELLPDTHASLVYINQPYFKDMKWMGSQSKNIKVLAIPGSIYAGMRIQPWIDITKTIGDKRSLLNSSIKLAPAGQDYFMEWGPTELFKGGWNHSIWEGYLNQFIVRQELTVSPVIKEICNQLLDGVRIKDLSKKIPSSIRPIQKKFLQITGLTMTEFRNINRLEKTVRIVYNEEENVTNAALTTGYTDHAHFSNDFRKYMDSTIGKFLTRPEHSKPASAAGKKE